MFIIGERINSTRPKVHEAIMARNSDAILKEARDQLDAGAGFIDINCAVTERDEVQDLDWVISVLQSGIKDVNICIDSPNYLAIERGLSTYKAKGALMINSITGEESRMSKIVPLAIKYKAALIALTMNDKGMPETASERFEIAKDILERVKNRGFNVENLYIDPLIRPISTEPAQAIEFLKAIPLIKCMGGVKTICGISNISFGLPERGIINSAFLSMAIRSGLDAAILDPTDKRIISTIRASNALLGMDDYCAQYLKAFREGRLA